ncbi:ABC transporter permease subunit [bacterium]|nr:ABC transporter permease subunit [bacterium]
MSPQRIATRRRCSDAIFFTTLGLLGGSYVVLILALLTADALFTTPGHMWQVIQQPEIQYSLRLTLVTCSISAILSLWVGTALGYLLSRYQFPGRWLIDTLIEIPVVLPPLVLGLSLLILFHLDWGGWRLEDALRDRGLPVTFHVPAIILAQFAIGCAFTSRTMRVTFDEINPRAEQVARTLGCSRAGAFWQIALPQAQRGLVAAGVMAWARSLGEFGPILVFAGATRMKTEVLSTSVYFEWSVGHLETAVAVSLLMVVMALGVLITLRWLGVERSR